MRVVEVANIAGCGRELSRFLERSEGSRFACMQWAELVADDAYGAFCKALAAYANSKSGPKSDGRHELFVSVHDMFEKGNEVGGADVRRRYNLDKSFIGTDEANLMLLKAAHEGMTQHEIAVYLGCSRTSVQKRLAALGDGVRFWDSYIKAEPSGRGGIKSTVHPVFLPLRLSEAFLLIGALKEYAQGRPAGDAEAEMADDLARRVYGQLSDYARAGIDGALAERGITLAGTNPDFDSAVVMTDYENLVMYDKMGARIKVRVGGEELVGRYAHGASLKDCENAGSGSFEAGYFAMRLDDGVLRAVDWGQVLSVERVD